VPDEPEFAAFLSYVRSDDEHEGGGITALAAKLAGEIGMQRGRPFEIFRDVDDVLWGQNWRRRIDDTLDAATLLIPIVTPAFFERPQCRLEVERFLEREQRLGRDDLIFPIRYMESAADDGLARKLATRQAADWTELRFEPLTSPVVRRQLADLAGRVRTVLGEVERKAGPARAVEHATPGDDEAGAGAPLVNEPVTIVVDPLGRDGPVTIGEAIALAGAGGRILVRPGMYHENVVVDSPLEIIGQGAREDIVVSAERGVTLLFNTSFGRVTNLTLWRETTVKSQFSSAVRIVQGRLELEECDLRSDAATCLVVRGGADPRVRRNRIHDGRSAGVIVGAQALGTFEDNEICRNRSVAVEVRGGAAPTFRRNRLFGSGGGLFIHERARGTYEDNEIRDNLRAGVEVRQRGAPTLRHNRIVENAVGVWVYDGGGGVFEDNEIEGTGSWVIEDDCVDNVTVRGNTPEWTKS
jgi:F-box protein 11